jgi:ATP-dependent protease ClpP protease subunit
MTPPPTIAETQAALDKALYAELEQACPHMVDVETEVRDLNFDWTPRDGLCHYTVPEEIDRASMAEIRTDFPFCIDEEGAPGTVLFDIESYGGDPYAAQTLADSMAFHANRQRLITVAGAGVVSAAVTAFLAGEERWAWPSTRFMTHAISTTTVTDSDAERFAYLKDANALSTEMREYYQERTGMSAECARYLTEEADKVFPGDTALKLGFAHCIMLQDGQAECRADAPAAGR